MNTRFRPYDPEQSYLLPPSPSDWLGEGHLAYFVAEIVDTLEVDGFYARYEGDGRRNNPYDPRMLLKVLVYGYASGVFSSRKIAGRGCGVSSSGGWEFSGSSDGEPVSAGAWGRVRGDLRASGETGAGDEADPDGDAGD